MVWGGIMGRRKTNLIVVQGNLNAQGFINQILQPEAVPFLQRHGPAILMHDNARPHVATICRQFLNRNNINILPWPAMSLDMNPKEHIWDYLGRKVRARGNIHNLRDLENTLIQEWNNIPNVVIRQYVRSLRGHLAACINSRGGHTRYWLQYTSSFQFKQNEMTNCGNCWFQSGPATFIFTPSPFLRQKHILMTPEFKVWSHDYNGHVLILILVPNTWTLSIMGNRKSPKTKCTFFLGT